MVDTQPAVLGVLVDVEGMGAVDVVPRKFSILNWVVDVLSPEGVNSTLIEEVLGGTFSQTEDAMEVLLCSRGLSVGLDLHPT